MPAHLPLVIGAGTSSALLFVVLAGLLFAPVPLIAVGLRLGWTRGLLAALIGAVGVGLVAQSLGVVGLYLAVDVLPALVILHGALRPLPGVTMPNPARPEHWTGVGTVLASLALVPAVGVLAAAVLTGGSVSDLMLWVAGGPSEGSFVDSVVAQAGAIFGPDMGAAIAERASQPRGADLLAVSFLVTATTVWLVQAMLAGVLGAVLAARMGPTVRPRPTYGDLRLPGWYGVVFALAGLAATVSDLALAVVCGLGVPFIVLGFKLVHVAVRPLPGRWVLLAVFYWLCLMLFTISPLVMVFVGLVEFATDLRREPGGRSMEDE